MNKISILKDNKGAALIIAMLIMVVLIILGVTAIMTSSIETKISGYRHTHNWLGRWK